MKKEFCMMAIGLLLAGCSADEEIANVQTSETNAISFNVVSNNPQTKAMIINPASFTNYPFEVFALKNGQSFIGNSSLGWRGGVTIEYYPAKSMWDYANSADMLYWPHVEALDFYAISPATVHPNNWTINGEEQSLSITLGDEYSSGSTGSDHNVDMMYACALQQKKADTNNGKITLQFKHALCQALFKAKKRDENLKVEIKRMEIANVFASGKFSFPNASSTSGSWSDYAVRMHYTVGMNSSPISVTAVGDSETEISGSNPMLFIPQTLVKWEPTQSTIENVDRDKNHSYLKITCRIYQESDSGGSHFFIPKNATAAVDDDGYGVMYVPFEATWESGKRYVYTLIFGAGYNADGSENDIVPITFNAEVENWESAPLIKEDF